MFCSRILKLSTMKTKLNFLKVIFIISVSLFIFSCENNVEEEMISLEETSNDNNGNGDGNGNQSDNNITFSGTIQPIINGNCLACHGNGGNFPNLTSFSNISRNAGSIKSAVVSRRMPQGGSLSQTDIDAIASWVDAGAPNN